MCDCLKTLETQAASHHSSGDVVAGGGGREHTVLSTDRCASSPAQAEVATGLEARHSASAASLSAFVAAEPAKSAPEPRCDAETVASGATTEAVASGANSGASTSLASGATTLTALSRSTQAPLKIYSAEQILEMTGLSWGCRGLCVEGGVGVGGGGGVASMTY